MKILGIILLVVAALALLSLAGRYISPQGELTQADAIVAVSGGDTKARAETAVRLYEGGWAPQLIFSGAARDPESKSNAQAMAEIAEIHGIDSDQIRIEERSRNTTENAREVAAIIQEQQHQKIILVTSPYHQRRTFLEFQSHLGEETEIINHSARDNLWGPRKWWVTPQGWYLTATEAPKALWTDFRIRFLD